MREQLLHSVGHLGKTRRGFKSPLSKKQPSLLNAGISLAAMKAVGVSSLTPHIPDPSHLVQS